MKILIFKSLFLFLPFSLFAEESTLFQNGYNNGDMATNGEHLFLDTIFQEAKMATIIDVGANIGIWTNAILSKSKNALVYCFEPSKCTYRILKKNFLGNKRVKLINKGLHFEENNSAVFYNYSIDSLNSLYNRPVLKNLLKCTPRKVIVSLTTLDTFCKEENITYIDLLKIDTEGNERNVLLGATKMLEEGKIGAIQFEYGGCYEDAKTTLYEVYTMLSGFGYKISRLIPEGSVEIKEWDESLENFLLSNWIAIKQRSD